MHTTNYKSAFIAAAEDCPVKIAEIPPTKAEEQTIASLQYDLISANPYCLTSDDVIFGVHARRKGLSIDAQTRSDFFSKAQACMRASPLTKRYGWGIHSDSEGKIAIVALGSSEYENFRNDTSLKQLKAMRQAR